jgi:transcriptional regulator
MYIPAAFAMNDVEKLTAFIESNSFATLVTFDGTAPFATPLPFLFDRERRVLRGHMARANPQWQHFHDSEALIIFQGPHAYISPSWYQTEPAVPTWNYLTVHAYGVPQLVDETTLANILRDLVAQHESAQPVPWPGDLPDDFWNRMLKGIVGFEIPISRWEGKWKLGQNRSPQDLQGVYEALSQSSDQTEQQLAAAMQQERDDNRKMEF